MKKNRILSFHLFDTIYKTPEFIFLTGVMLCGILAGSLTGLQITSASGRYIIKLAEYVSQAAAPDVSAARLLWIIGGDFIYIGILMLFSCVWRNAYLTGLQIAGKGFMLSFTICAFLGYHQSIDGLKFSVFYTGLPGVFLLPAILYMGSIGLLAAGRGKGNRFRLLSGYRKEILLSCLFLLLANSIRALYLYSAVL